MNETVEHKCFPLTYTSFDLNSGLNRVAFMMDLFFQYY